MTELEATFTSLGKPEANLNKICEFRTLKL